MLEFRHAVPSPNVIRSKASDEGNCTTGTPMMVGDVLFMPAVETKLGADGKDADSLEVGMFFMKATPEMGVYMKLTSKMLREIGEAMLTTAGSIDRYASEQATAALANAARK